MREIILSTGSMEKVRMFIRLQVCEFRYSTSVFSDIHMRPRCC
jgi:hypothetical protein